MTRRAVDALVIGGGAIGAACAFELARRGAQVTLIEREAAVGLGCSYGNAGLVGAGLALPLATPQALREGVRSVFKSDAPFHLRPAPSLIPWLARFTLAASPGRHRIAAAALAPLGVTSFRMHLEYAQAGVETGLENRGALLTWEDEAVFESGIAELHAAGASPTVFRGREARQVEPSLSQAVAGAAFTEDVAHTDSRTWTQGVVQAAVDAGATVRSGVTVNGLVAGPDGVRAVETSDGLLGAGTFVLAAGAWTGALTRPLGIPLPMQAGKGYHVDLDLGDLEPRMPIYMQEAHVVATPLGRCLRLAGTLELTGLDTRINIRRTDAILHAAARTLTGVGGRQVQELWAGLRPCAADGLPVIGAPVRFPNLLLATGHAMIGLALAPVTGRLIAELASGEAPVHPLAAFSPNRF